MIKQSVPFIDLKRSCVRDPKFYDEIREIVSLCNFSGGPTIEKFESMISERLLIKHAVGCANGTDALQIALKALDIGPGDKVIIPDLTFWATCEAVVTVGAEPVILDIELDTFSIDPQLLENFLKKSQVKALILVNLYGGASKHINEISSMCKNYGVFLIQDNAQAYGVKFKGESIFKNYADICTTSFYPAKVLGAAGDAGAIFSNNDELALKARMIANHGRKDHYSYDYFGYNSRIDVMQASYLMYKLQVIDLEIKSRVYTNITYHNYIDNAALKIFSFPEEISGNGYLNVMLLNSKEQRISMEDCLKRNGIGYGRVYPETISEQSICKKFQVISKGNAEMISKTILNLPLFPGITDDEISHVVNSVNNCKL